MKARTGARGIGGGSGGRPSNRRRPLQGIPSVPPPDPPPPSATVTPEIIAFRDAAKAKAESAHAMAMDANMQREMVALTHTLAPRAGATHVAVQDGNWTDPETWLNNSDAFEVPPAGAKMLIPQGITVTMDNNTTTAYDWLRHDGTLTFIHTGNTTLYIDTIVSDHSSVWNQGTVANPIPAAYTSRVRYLDNGDLNPEVDALLIGRGWVSMGTVNIHGAAKKWRCKASQARSIGANTLLLDEEPTGWAIGDEICIGGTRLRGHDTRGNYNALDAHHTTITDIAGNTITFADALTTARDLSAPRANADFSTAYYIVGNYSRNVIHESPPGTAIHRRGHIMWMHSEVDARYAASNLMGRTRKDLEIAGFSGRRTSFDGTDDANRIVLMGGDLPWPADASIRGRYNWHLHRAGVMPGQPVANLVGLAASDFPGWGYAHHSSRANITECVVRRGIGAGFMAEVGDELGTWTRCLAQDVINPLPPASGGRVYWSEQNEKTGYTQGEFGKFGSAFWGRSRVVQLVDCECSDCDNFGVWQSRGNIVAPPPLEIPLPRQMFGGQRSAAENANSPVLVIRNGYAVATRLGLHVVKAAIDQKHTHRSLFTNFTCVNAMTAADVEYTVKYTFQDMKIWCDHSAFSGLWAVVLGAATVDLLFRRLTVRNAARGVLVNVSEIQRGTDWEHTFIDYVFQGSGSRIGGGGSTFPGWEAEYLNDLAEADISQGRTLTWTPNVEPVFPSVTTDDGSPGMILAGPMTDSVFENKLRNLYTGVKPILVQNGLYALLARDGYWTYTHPTHGASRYLLLPDMLTDRTFDDVTDDYVLRYLTLPVRVVGYNAIMDAAGWVNNGALPTRYVDAITAGTYVVYEAEPA